MAYVSGTAGSVAYVSGGTTVVVGAYEWGLDLGQETPETTAFGENWKTFIPGIREWSGNVSMRGDASAASQAFIRNMLLGGSAAIEIRFFQGTNYYAGSALANGASPGIAYDGVSVYDTDLQGSGPLIYV